ncbi:hypothetical protein QJS10_CPB11g01066 [Acorus calamus]|uniref:Uncharacterized protein n=1 Tax=Acorus calamus TaxID=4465 RepID=A0AAV9DRD9_ACOCL|nr:hypothetical protein QJS10_CPB11g01066 [Acorus calamus]
MAALFSLWSLPDRKDEQEVVEEPAMEQRLRPAKPRARKAGGGSSMAPKKKPQRGLGVAQLERLRIQEQLRTIAASDHPPPSNDDPNNPCLSVAGGGVAPGGFASMSYFSGGVGGGWGEPTQQVRSLCYRYGIGGGGFAASGVRSGVSDQYAVDRLRFHAGQAVCGPAPTTPPSSRELSSSQKERWLPPGDHCQFCVKKGSRPTEKSIDGADFLGLSIGSVRTVDGSIGGDRFASSNGAVYAEEGFQRDDNGEGRREPTTYDFFADGSSHGAPQASDQTVRIAEPFAADPIIDLSLKLSF